MKLSLLLRVQDVLTFILNQTSEPVYIVGGVVRDMLLDKESGDIDFVFRPPNVRELIESIAEQFRTPLVVLDDSRDIYRLIYRGVTLDFAKMTFPLIEDDLKARDLTINSLALPLKQNMFNESVYSQILDPCGGMNDLKMGLIRSISKQNLFSDPLRVLRIFRFATRLNFQIDEQTLQWASEVSPFLSRSARERVIHELELIFLTSRSVDIFNLMLRYNILHDALPSELDLQYFAHFERLLKTCEQLQINAQISTAYPQGVEMMGQTLYGKRNYWVVLKLFLMRFTLVPKHKTHEFLEEMLLSRREKSVFKKLDKAISIILRLKNEMHPHPKEQLHLFQALKNDFWVFYFLLKTQNKDTLADALAQIYMTPHHPCAHPNPLLSGHEIQQVLKLSPGPQIGEYIQWLLEAQAEKKIASKEEAVEYLVLRTNQPK